MSISLINQIHHHFHHHVLLLCLTLCNHQGQCNKRVVSQTLCAVRTIQDAVVIQEPQKLCGCNTFVAITEGVVLRHQIQQHSSLLLHTRIEFLASKRLIDLTDAALKRIVLLIAKKRAATKFLTQTTDSLHCILVGSMEGLLLRGFINRQPLVVVIIKCV